MIRAEGSAKAIVAPCVVNGVRARALLDCGSTISAIDARMVEKLKLVVMPTQGNLVSADRSSVKRQGTVCVEVQIADGNGPHSLEVEVMNLTHEVLFGLNVWPLFGFRVVNVPATFPERENAQQEDRDGYDMTAVDGELSSARAYMVYGMSSFEFRMTSSSC